MNLKKFEDIFKQGYIILYKHEETHWLKGWFSNRIVAKQKQLGFIDKHAQYTHAEICGGRIREGNNIVGYQSINVAPPKSRWIDLTKDHKGRYVTVLKHKEYTDEIRRHVAYASARLNNLAYDKRGILAFAISWIRQNNRLYFCSEHCITAIRVELPKTLGNTPADKIMPAHFFIFKHFEKIWEGRIE